MSMVKVGVDGRYFGMARLAQLPSRAQIYNEVFSNCVSCLRLSQCLC